MFTAVEAGKREMVDFLLKDGFKLIKDDRGMNPLHVAVLASDFEMVQLLLKVHSNAFYIKPKEFQEHLVNQAQDEGFTPVHYAAFKGNIKMLDLLLSMNGNL